MENEIMNSFTVANRVKDKINLGKISLPENYRLDIALQAAYLKIEQTIDAQKRPALSVCDQNSVFSALFDMAIQGLNPIKEQCYFVVYGNKLRCMRSYMGSMMLAKQLNPKIEDIRAQLVYEDDKFCYDITNGQKIVNEHIQQIENIADDKIIGGYAMAVDANDKVLFSDLMTINDIKRSWMQSQLKPVNADGSLKAGSTHIKFSEQMAKRTIISRLCKKIISTASDNDLVISADRSDEETASLAVIREEINENANKKLIDFEDKKPQVKSNVAMATEGHAKVVYDLSKQLKRHATLLSDCSEFIGRPIQGIREMTEEEIENYIGMLENEIMQSQNIA